jgi:hypothetical protein
MRDRPAWDHSPTTGGRITPHGLHVPVDLKAFVVKIVIFSPRAVRGLRTWHEAQFERFKIRISHRRALVDRVYVLWTFQKKSKHGMATLQAEIEIRRRLRLAEVIGAGRSEDDGKERCVV